MKYTFYIGIVLILAIGCNRQLPHLEQALTGENRTERETVLAHYIKDPADSLKYQAACFLIENMPGKRTLDTLSVAANQPYFEALAAARRLQGKYREGLTTVFRICDSVKVILPPAVKPGPIYTHDLKTVTTQFLIRQEGHSDYTIVYTNVPKGALLNIHNHTRGKENRPFTYENGKQVWW
jgi:hypothetical protein